MAAKPERDGGHKLARAIILLFLWVLFGVTLFISAREGVAFAKKDLSAGNGGPIPFALGTTVTVDAERKAVAFGINPQVLQRYFLAFAVSGGADSPDLPQGIVMMEGAVRVNPLDRDENLVKVRIAEGEHRDEIYWVRRDHIRLSE